MKPVSFEIPIGGTFYLFSWESLQGHLGNLVIKSILCKLVIATEMPCNNIISSLRGLKQVAFIPLMSLWVCHSC